LNKINPSVCRYLKEHDPDVETPQNISSFHWAWPGYADATGIMPQHLISTKEKEAKEV